MGHAVTAGQPDDDRLAASVQIEIPDRVAQGALGPESPEEALVVGKAVQRDGLVHRPTPGATEKRRDRRRDPGEGADTARYLLDVDAWIGECR